MGGFCLETGRWWRMDFDYDTQDRLRSHVQGRDDLPISVLDLLAMVVTAWAFTVEAKSAPQYAGVSIIRRGDNMSAVHWVNRCRGGTRAEGGRTNADIGCLEMHSGWCFRTKHVRGVRMFWRTEYHGGIGPPSPPTSSRSVPTSIGRSSAWGRRGRISVPTSWPPVRRRLSCELD